MTYRILMMALSTLLFAHAIQAEPVAGNENTQKKTLSVCLGPQQLSVPLGMDFRAISASDRKMINLSNLYKMSLEERENLVAQEPLNVSTVFLRSRTVSAEMPSVLELLLKRATPYRIFHLRLDVYPKPVRGGWLEREPKVVPFPEKNTDAFAPTQAMFNNHSVKVRCIPGMPKHSRDEASRWCTVYGFIGQTKSLRFSVVTGRDLAGHWPTADTDWDTLEMAGWAAPLKELEEGLKHLTAPPPPGATLCE
ncbi:MAG: hypothetical protein GY767_08350 [Shimia sp.]|nr:hypothetical protein [Shimia sp.]MCP4823238.1 hypothetical protein [Shimia sp.]